MCPDSSTGLHLPPSTQIEVSVFISHVNDWKQLSNCLPICTLACPPKASANLILSPAEALQWLLRILRLKPVCLLGP